MSYQYSTQTPLPDMLKEQAGTRPPRSGRFAPTRGIRAVRAAYGLLCKAVPQLAARLAYAQLARPPRAAAGDRHHALRQQAFSRRIRFGDGELALLEWGQGPAVLMVHGWGSHATHMGRMIGPLVGAGFRVIAFDAPAHGMSSGRSTDLVQFASAIASVAAYAGPLHAVVGHSFGAAMAMYAWRDWGVEAERMVLISSFEHCNWFVEAFGRHVGLTTGVLERVRQMLVRLYGGRLDWSRMSVADMVRAVDFPVLIVHDQDDDEIPFEHGLALAGARPGAQFKATRGHGHQLVVRNADVIDGVVRFLAQ
jgi:pimeloyl-ACP methyl ester carboxylesterase